MWPREKYSEHPSWLTHPKNTIVPFISRRHAELWRLYFFVEFLVSHYILIKLILISQKVPNLISFQNEMKSRFPKVVCRTLTCRAKSLLNLLQTPSPSSLKSNLIVLASFCPIPSENNFSLVLMKLSNPTLYFAKLSLGPFDAAYRLA